jgi:hypothetical protein
MAERRILLLELQDADGASTWAECVAFSLPIYRRDDRHRMARGPRTNGIDAASRSDDLYPQIAPVYRGQSSQQLQI